MDRISESNTSKAASEKWSVIIPKIWRIAHAENSPNIVALLDELEEDGKGDTFSFCS